MVVLLRRCALMSVGVDGRVAVVALYVGVPVRAYVVQPLFGVAAVLPPTRFCRESRAYCYIYARSHAAGTYMPLSLFKIDFGAVRPAAVGSVNDVDAPTSGQGRVHLPQLRFS